jgi:uncharacterized protein YbgA (DUF1722 family)/uncharacterized protein YbbK (DUF523 family)
VSDTDRSRREPVLRLGVSSCLLGEHVRYDGGHKRDPFLVGTLGRFVEWVPVCPEVEMGLAVPRQAMRLVGDPDEPRLVTSKTGQDYTEAMQAWAQRRVEELAGLDLHGYVCKKDSPSSGLYRVRVYGKQGMPSRTGTGMFPRALMARLPLLPLEEEGRLEDVRLRENFIDRVFAYYRWTRLLAQDPTASGLIAFHTAHKATVLSHSPQAYSELGRLVARAGELSWDRLACEYGRIFMGALRLLATPGKHANVLQHLFGFLKSQLSAEDKAEMVGLIEDYRSGLVPLIVPLTMLRHHLDRYPVRDWVCQQVYLNPYPKELMLRNHV